MQTGASDLAVAGVFLLSLLVCALEIGRSTHRARPGLGGLLLDVRDREPEWPLVAVAAGLVAVAFAGAFQPWLLLAAVPLLVLGAAYVHLSVDQEHAVVTPLPAHSPPRSNIRVVERT